MKTPNFLFSKKLSIAVISFLLIASIILGTTSSTTKIFATTDGVVNWGVNPNTRGRTPEPPSGGAALLKEHNGIFVGNTEEKKVYFTFDLGYEAGYTEEVLDILKKHDIKAVFFLCGNYLKEDTLINRMMEDGHVIGNHTDKHKDLPSLSDDGIKADIADFDVKFNAAFPNAPKTTFFRPPQGKFCKRTLVETNAQGLKTLMWSIAIVDWGKTPIDATASANKIASRLHNGAIILLHITNSGTPKMLEQLIPQMATKGYSAGHYNEL